MHMTDKEKRTIGVGMLDRLIWGQKSGKSQSEIIEGIRAGFASDYLNLDDALVHGSTVTNPANYSRSVEGREEAPRKVAPLERNLSKRLEQARQLCATEAGSPEYREMLIKQKKVQIHREMTQRGTDEISSRIRGYDVTLLRLPEVEAESDMRKIKMFVNGAEISDKQFNEALAEVAGFNDGKAFNTAAQAAMDLKAQANIQCARTVAQAGINVAKAPARAVSQAAEKGNAMAGQLLRLFFQLVLVTSRSR